MARGFCTFGVVILLAAFVLQFLVSVSLPYLTSFDIVRVDFQSGQSRVGENRESISELKLGIWAYCETDGSTGDESCVHTGHGYPVSVLGPENNQVATIRASWTNGLAVHPVATAVIFGALLLSFSMHVTVTLIASLVSFLAALITLIAFAIDIALYALTKHEMDGLGGVKADTRAGPGFWITLVTFILLLIAGCTVCAGRHRDRRSGRTSMFAEKRPFWRMWRRRGN